MYELIKLSNLEKQIYICLLEIIFTRIIGRYLKKVEFQQRPLNFFENSVITVALQGMAASQIFSFLIMDYCFVTKDGIIALDVLSFIIASRNLYSCVMSPKIANSFLEKIKTEMDAARENLMEEVKKHYKEKTNVAKESLKKLEDRFKGLTNPLANQEQSQASEAEIRETKAKIAEQYEAIEKLQLDFIGENRRQLDAYENVLKVCRQRIKETKKVRDENRMAELEKNESLYQKRIEQYTKETEESQQKYLNDKGAVIKDKGAKKEYLKFIENSKKNLGKNTLIDQNGRIIRAVTSMDAERVFYLVSKTKSTVRFAFGLVANTESVIRFPGEEDIILYFNEEFRVHPSALEQMDVIPDGRKKDDLKNMLELTQKFNAEVKTKENTGNYLTKKETRDYLKKIGDLLKKEEYRFISDTEIEVFIKETLNNKLTKLADKQKSYFENLKPEVVYRLRQVVEDDDRLDSKSMQVVVKLAEERGVANDPREIANCIEIVKIHMNDRVKELRANAQQNQPMGDTAVTEEDAEKLERVKEAKAKHEKQKKELNDEFNTNIEKLKKALDNGEIDGRSHDTERKKLYKQRDGEKEKMIAEFRKVLEVNRIKQLKQPNKKDLYAGILYNLLETNSEQMRALNNKISEKIA
ncbi:hypothetical protein WR25_12764, partial [Diploscapter pachys]